MKKQGELRNQLKAVRTRLGMSQQDLATAAGVARQTIGGIEAGTYALSLTVALCLSKTLGCSVDELFWLESEMPGVEATPIPPSGTTYNTNQDVSAQAIRVALAQVQGRWVASPLVGGQGFRREMLPADGIGTWGQTKQSMTVHPLDTPETLAQTVFLAGCTPALSLWTRSAERWHPGLRTHWLHANSTIALEYLAQGLVHLAGVHVYDPVTGEDNRSFVKAAMHDVPTVLVNLGVWEEGFVTVPGNPKNLYTGADLARTGIHLINREEGAGSRLLLDWLLRKEGISASSIAGYDAVVTSHLDIAEAIGAGRADIGVSTAALAEAYGLSFVPLRSVRYDLALRKETLASSSVQQLLGTLQHRWVRSQLATLGGYDTSYTGEITDV